MASIDIGCDLVIVKNNNASPYIVMKPRQVYLAGSVFGGEASINVAGSEKTMVTDATSESE